MANRINIKNKKAYHDFELIERYTAGVQLQGTEIKSIRLGKVSIGETFCQFYKNEQFIRGLQIAEYAWASYNSHEPGRERKLLLNRKELNKLLRKVKESGLTIVALRVYIGDNGFAKIEIALAKGRKEYDKREVIKRKDTQRQMDRLNRIK